MSRHAGRDFVDLVVIPLVVGSVLIALVTWGVCRGLIYAGLIPAPTSASPKHSSDRGSVYLVLPSGKGPKLGDFVGEVTTTEGTTVWFNDKGGLCRTRAVVLVEQQK